MDTQNYITIPSETHTVSNALKVQAGAAFVACLATALACITLLDPGAPWHWQASAAILFGIVVGFWMLATSRIRRAQDTIERALTGAVKSLRDQQGLADRNYKEVLRLQKRPHRFPDTVQLHFDKDAGREYVLHATGIYVGDATAKNPVDSQYRVVHVFLLRGPWDVLDEAQQSPKPRVKAALVRLQHPQGQNSLATCCVAECLMLSAVADRALLRSTELDPGEAWTDQGLTDREAEKLLYEMNQGPPPSLPRMQVFSAAEGKS